MKSREMSTQKEWKSTYIHMHGDILLYFQQGVRTMAPNYFSSTEENS